MLSRHTLAANWNQALNKAIRYESAIERVRELHEMINGPYDDAACKHCTTLLEEMYGLTVGLGEPMYVEYPCPTIQALEGNE